MENSIGKAWELCHFLTELLPCRQLDPSVSVPKCGSTTPLLLPSNAALAGCQAAREAGEALQGGEMQLERQNATLHLCYLALYTCLRFKKYL